MRANATTCSGSAVILAAAMVLRWIAILYTSYFVTEAATKEAWILPPTTTTASSSAAASSTKSTVSEAKVRDSKHHVLREELPLGADDVSASPDRSRREAIVAAVASATGLGLTGPFGAVAPLRPKAAVAYTPDPDRLRESLYLISRVQEATVQQERLVSRGGTQEDLRKKMKLSLRLVDRSYRLLDQVNYLSAYVDPPEALVTAVEAGEEAADALQSAIDYVDDELRSGPLTDDQRDFLTGAMRTTRDELFRFMRYMPPEKLQEARRRVEVENVDNREEFDGDADAGVYNPVVLPWKQ